MFSAAQKKAGGAEKKRNECVLSYLKESGYAVNSKTSTFIPSCLDFRAAFFLSSMPYRKRLYRDGGWLRTSGPGSPEWEGFLHEYFTRDEIKISQEHAQSHSTVFQTLRRQMRFTTIWEWFPEILLQIFDPPPVLFVMGDDFTDPAQRISVVGTRSPASVSLLAARASIARARDENPGIVVVSGFARGLDREAHLGAIENHAPQIAVLGSGFCHIGPSANLDIPQLAAKKGTPFTFLTEFPPALPGSRDSFPRRNRIIAGLSQDTYIIQAPYKSGAMITARYALDEGRDVSAFDHELLQKPGLNEGARSLLEDGAGRLEFSGEYFRIITEPPYRKSPQNEQLEFWEDRLSGRIEPLGGGLYRKIPE